MGLVLVTKSGEKCITINRKRDIEELKLRKSQEMSEECTGIQESIGIQAKSNRNSLRRWNSISIKEKERILLRNVVELIGGGDMRKFYQHIKRVKEGFA